MTPAHTAAPPFCAAVESGFSRGCPREALSSSCPCALRGGPCQVWKARRCLSHSKPEQLHFPFRNSAQSKTIAALAEASRGGRLLCVLEQPVTGVPVWSSGVPRRPGTAVDPELYPQHFADHLARHMLKKDISSDACSRCTRAIEAGTGSTATAQVGEWGLRPAVGVRESEGRL